MTFFVWRRRATPGALYLVFPMLTVTFWSLGYTCELASTTLPALIFWNKVQYIFIQGTLIAWLVFVFQYTGYEKWLTRRNLLLLGILPAITLTLAWSNELHGMLWQDIRLDPDSAVISMISVRGPWYWITAAYSYLMLLWGTLLLVLAFFRSPHLYRRQTGTLLIAVLTPWISNILYLADLSPVSGFELTPAAFTITNMAFAWSLFRYRLLDIMPFARTVVFEEMTDAVMVLDMQCRIVDLNPAAQRLFAYTTQEPIGQPVADALSDWPVLFPYCQATKATQTQVSVQRETEKQTFDLRVTLLTDHRKRNTGRLVILRDITEQAQATEQREQLIAELDAFAHTVAHDLKTPLTAIVGYGNLLETRFDRLSMDKVNSFLRVIGQNGRKMGNIIDELLLLASVRNLQDVKLKPLNMNQIVTEAQTRLNDLIKEHQAEIVAPQEWPQALGYASWVEEVWVNYISNAVKYGGHKAEGIMPRVELGATPLSNGQIRFWARDNGAGMTEKEKNSLFTQFTRLEKVKAKGHGLGLSIVRRIMDKLGGQVGVESQVGQGSVFSFTLPAVSANSTTTEE